MLGLGLSLTSVAVLGGSSPATTPQVEILTRDGSTILSRSGATIIAR